MRRRRMTKVSFNSKLIVDVVGASLIVQQFPKLLSSVIPLDPMLQAVAGVGGGYVAGMVLKRPDLANASIALGVVDFVAPLVDSLLGGGSSLPPVGGAPLVKAGIVSSADRKKMPMAVNDYLNLNDYINLSASQVNETYRNSY